MDTQTSLQQLIVGALEAHGPLPTIRIVQLLVRFDNEEVDRKLHEMANGRLVKQRADRRWVPLE